MMPEEHDRESVKRFRVVAALIRDDDKILLTQRWPGKHLGMIWEFPGGKVEPGENDHEALRRELLEELGIDIEIGSCCFETCHGYGNREVHLLIYRCTLASGTPTALDVKAVEWAPETSLLTRNFPPADIPFVQELAAGRIPLNEEAAKVKEEEENEETEPVFKKAKIIDRVAPGFKKKAE